MAEEQPEKKLEAIAAEKPQGQHNTSEKDSFTLTGRVRENPWVLATVVLGIVTILLLVGQFSGGVTGGVTGVAKQTDVETKVIDFLNSQVTNGSVTLVKSEVKNGLYEITVSYQGMELPVYATIDGEALVQGVTPLGVLQEQLSKPDTGASTGTGTEVVDASFDDDAVKGNANAKVTIIEFSDYECPFCGKHFKETYPQIVKEYVDTGKVKLVFRDFPLSFHASAQKAAEAAECAGEQNKYWQMHDKLFSNQQALDVDSLKIYAKDIGLNTATFNACLDDGKMVDEVAKDFADGQSYGVTGTPAFFINGRFIAGAYTFADFKKIIDEELAKVSA